MVKRESVRYSYRTVVRCPRCGGLESLVRSTQGPKRYRECCRCGRRFVEVGERVTEG